MNITCVTTANQVVSLVDWKESFREPSLTHHLQVGHLETDRKITILLLYRVTKTYPNFPTFTDKKAAFLLKSDE